ncbi:MAG: zinc-binding dehydrogenase, partial [Dehalococcoidia bacterium]|nr:zinc-binding dehydrogenase [Dehalococcoidia bacterium]
LGDNVVVAGAGAIGLCVIQLLKLSGARHITVLQPSAKKRELALKFGADLSLNAAEEGANLQSKIKALYGDVGADVSFECAGSPDALLSAISLIKGGGQVLVLGVSGEPTPIVEAPLVLSEIEMKFSLAYSAEDIHIFLDMLTTHRIKTDGMVSDIIHLDDIVEKGFERMANTKGLVKVLVAP